MFVISGVMFFFLPDQIPILHNGVTDYPIPSVLGVWLFPLIALIINITFIKQNRLSKMNSAIFGILLMVMLMFYFSVM